MRALAEDDRRLCTLQAKLFEASLEFSDCGSAVFVRRFMRSDLARRLDLGAALFESFELAQAVQEVDAQFGGSGYGSERYTANEMHWMGYVYRHWCCEYELASKAVYKLVGARELRELYYPYHSLDASQAVARIQEAKGIPQDKRSIAYGVERLRAIRSRR